MYTLLHILLISALLLPVPDAFASLDDIDGDGISNAVEDANGNGIVDDGETDPLNVDTDHGGESDGSEIRAGRNPLIKTDDTTYDADGDGMTNGEENAFGTDPANPDTDEDGTEDANDAFPLEAAYQQDADNDGLPYAFEHAHGLSDEDSADAATDLDGDGLNNLDEFIYGTDVEDPDTDEDGMVDGEEVAQGEEPLESTCLQFTNTYTFFTDTSTHWAKTYINRLQRTKIQPSGIKLAEGYTQDGKRYFAPSQFISRFEFLKLTLLSGCIRLAEDKERLSVNFNDISSSPRPHESADQKLQRRVIYTGVRKDVVKGYFDNTFRPNAPINRAEAIKILLEATKLQPIHEESGKKFPDVTEADWFAKYIELATMHDIMSGYPDGFFRPEQPITRGEAAKIIYKLMIINPYVNGYVLPAEGIQ